MISQCPNTFYQEKKTYLSPWNFNNPVILTFLTFNLEQILFPCDRRDMIWFISHNISALLLSLGVRQIDYSQSRKAGDQPVKQGKTQVLNQQVAQGRCSFMSKWIPKPGRRENRGRREKVRSQVNVFQKDPN